MLLDRQRGYSRPFAIKAKLRGFRLDIKDVIIRH